jgi:heme-degrading monooxygenase HmoA
MIALTVSFQFGDDFDPARLQQIAQQASGKFEGLPGLRSKAFTIDAARRRAFNFYVWESEAAARAFFTPQAIAGAAKVYGVTPTIEYLPLAALVDNAFEAATVPQDA